MKTAVYSDAMPSPAVRLAILSTLVVIAILALLTLKARTSPNHPDAGRDRDGTALSDTKTLGMHAVDEGRRAEPGARPSFDDRT